MSSPASPDARRDAIRFCVDAVEREMERRPDQQTDALQTAWRDLVERLALGPAPELRTCPTCGQIVMRAATLCGHCWHRLTPGTEGQVAP